MRLDVLPLASALLFSSFAALLVAPSSGCSPSGNEDVGAAEQATTAEKDLTLAREIVAGLAGPRGKCKSCHNVTPSKLRAWGTSMAKIEAACFAPADLTSMQRVDCLRSDPTSPTSVFSPRRLGLYATGAGAAPFQVLFESAFTPDTWTSEFVNFAQQAAMPRSGPSLTSDEFEKMKGWVLRGMPQLEQGFIPSDAGSETPDAGDGGDAGGCAPDPLAPELPPICKGPPARGGLIPSESR